MVGCLEVQSKRDVHMGERQKYAHSLLIECAFQLLHPSTVLHSPRISFPPDKLTKGMRSRTSFWKMGTELMKSETATPAPAPQKRAEVAKGRRSLCVDSIR